MRLYTRLNVMFIARCLHSGTVLMCVDRRDLLAPDRLLCVIFGWADLSTPKSNSLSRKYHCSFKMVENEMGLMSAL